jgi:hypothetical protein
VVFHAENLVEALREHGLAAHALDRVDGQARRRQVVRQPARLDLEGHVLAQPGERELHEANCSRKRRSFS